MKIDIRKADINDVTAVFQLYKEVAEAKEGIARVAEEITPEYITDIFETSGANGLMMVGIEPTMGHLIAEIHASKYKIKIFDHVLTSLTIVVHPRHQGKRIGKQIFQAFLMEIIRTRKDIGRVELESRSSNPAALALYKSLGFMEEGRMKNKTRNNDGSFEDSVLMGWMNPAFNF